MGSVDLSSLGQEESEPDTPNNMEDKLLRITNDPLENVSDITGQDPYVEAHMEEPENTVILEQDGLDNINIENDNNEVFDVFDGNNNEIDGNLNEDEIHPEEPGDLIIEDQADLNIEDEMNLRYGPRNDHYDLRPRRPRDYSHLHATIDHICMTQYNLKRGLEMFGNEGIKAVQDELKQLHDRNVLSPVDGSALNTQQKQEALPYLMFLKQKRSGKIKGRGCADGRQQRLYNNKEDTSSPTVAIESVMLTSIIDASERRDIATVDIPGAFLQANMDEIVHMKITGTMVDILVNLQPDKYQKYVMTENTRQIMYVQ